MVDAAVLEDVPVLAVADIVTVPLPVPLPPDTTDSQEAPLDAVHVHPVWVVTETVPVIASAPSDALVGEMV